MDFVEVTVPSDLTDEFPALGEQQFVMDDPFYDDKVRRLFEDDIAQATVLVAVSTPVQSLRPLAGPPVSRLFHDVGRRMGDPLV